ncbi:uncharacterized protein LOC130942071 [Arachis stenosperma]|uniref:uncharacterized protein LOC130942071 n=1 Tax=Arachis stenosperma TaxID=217475 RepID=UPI0025AB88C7|nr:uncharacterized protein LOC130942071 [Arachis stenosperma]
MASSSLSPLARSLSPLMEDSNGLVPALTNTTVYINVHVSDDFYFSLGIPLVKNLPQLFISVILAAVIACSLWLVIQCVRGLLGRFRTWWGFCSLWPVIQCVRGLLGRFGTWLGSRSLVLPVFTREIRWPGHESTGQESTPPPYTPPPYAPPPYTPPPSTAPTPFRGPATKRKGVALFLRMRMDT